MILLVGLILIVKTKIIHIGRRRVGKCVSQSAVVLTLQAVGEVVVVLASVLVAVVVVVALPAV